MNNLKLTAARIFVQDLSLVLPFYKDTLGLEMIAGDSSLGFAVFASGCDGMTLVIEEITRDENDGLSPRFTALSLATDDIETRYAAMNIDGVTFDGPPEKQEWGGSLAHFSDPEGNVLTLVEYPRD